MPIKVTGNDTAEASEVRQVIAAERIPTAASTYHAPHFQFAGPPTYRTLIQLQRTAGNAAVGTLLATLHNSPATVVGTVRRYRLDVGNGPSVCDSPGPAANTWEDVLGALQQVAGTAPAERTPDWHRPSHAEHRSGPAPALVQRCGGETHEGCVCADQDQDGDRAPVQRLAATPTIQRQTIDLCAPPSPLADSPICKPARVVPAPPRYAALDQSLIDLVEASRLEAMIHPGNHFLDNAFGGGKLPRNWIEALDNFDDAGVSTLAQNNQLAREVPGLWEFLRFIKDTFWSTSQGFHFEARPGLRSFLRSSQGMCGDFVVTEIIHHGGADCFRQMGKDNVPGIHVCLDDETHGDIHVDKHQVTTGVKLPTGMCVFDVLGALPEHLEDLRGRGRFGAWQRHDLLKQNVEELRARIPGCGPAAILFQGEVDGLKAELEAIDSRTLASRGVKGERQMNRKLGPLEARLRRLNDATGQVCSRGGKLSCVPAGQLPGASTGTEVSAAAFTPTAGPFVALQTADDASGSDLVGLTRGDGITVGTWDRRPRVERLQSILNDKGAALTVDGMFGAQTATALRQLQARTGVPEQDTVDPATAQVLGGGPAPGARISRLEGLRHQDGITFGTWHLRPQVSELQGRLTGHGFHCAVDGMFGDRTLAALNAFQGLHQLPADTVVDRDTADALEDGGDQLQCPPGQVPIPDVVLV